MASPIVSVIMPVYNGERFLVDAIESILNQTFTDFELIIINDGSTDASLSIARKYQELDERVLLVSQDNIGLIKTLNKGIALARGEYIARMDSDDISIDNRIFEQVNLLEKGYDLCGCHFHFITESGQLSKSRVVSIDPGFQSIILTRSTPFAHGSVLIRKSFLTANNLHYSDNKYRSAEDYYLWVQCYNNGARITNVDKYLFLYRDFSSSLSKTNAKKNLGDARLISKKFIKNNFNKIEHDLILRLSIKAELNLFEQEQLSFFLFNTLLKRSLIKSFKYLRYITPDVKVVGFIRFLKSILS
ncbi:glycosyltransferase [Shewanella sp. DC2-4]|uniref:glycosyltransferase family 2 protein n=1 Tax=Shewanella sp. DC2-4 TaxID=2739431 RepID=UPI001562F593|nr:glycosyltransferase [Shewanella sp. DC2-4]NRD31335.1 glycosyltransferase [Shewanella sp. DC2-4]